MIANETYPNIPVKMLTENPEKYFLTGSRYFKNSNICSDWDYFTCNPNLPEIPGYVWKSIVKKYNIPNPTEQGMLEIYRLFSENCPEDTWTLDLQILKDLNTCLAKEAFQRAFKQAGIVPTRNIWVNIFPTFLRGSKM